MILVATGVQLTGFPCTAWQVQEVSWELWVPLDLISMLHAVDFFSLYNTAQAYIASGIYRTILIIGSESLSRIVDWTDRGTCILFGDGAGAVLLQAKEGKSYQPVSHSDGRGGPALTGPGVLEEHAVLIRIQKKQKQNTLP